ncbi:Transcription factor TFIID (or TATA-binding protein, TBP) [uncultured archaeon]|nr:Transcription factor TFIID (or TATA-binding protein, TBP) [uncultured archaeon]
MSGGVEVDYKVCGMMLKGRIKNRINLDKLYQLLNEKYSAEYNPDITNRVIVHLPDASVLFFTSGTIQIYLKDPCKKEETINEANKIIGLINPDFSAEF